MKKLIFGCVVGAVAISVSAESSTPPYPTTNEATGRGGWHITVGPAWRARVKMEMSGSAATPSVSTSQTVTDYDKNPGNGEWSATEVTETRPDPDGVEGDLWAVGATFTETTVTAGGGDAAMGAADEKSPLGLKAKFGYDMWANESFAVALDLRFAGYWNMRSSCSGRSGDAKMTTRTVTDYWFFENGPYPADAKNGRNFDYADDPVLDPGSRQETSSTTAFGGSAVRAKLSADLYQIGIGPTVSWRALSWLDAYAGVAALCNIASLDMSAGAKDSSETQCRFGVAAEVGLIGYLTENLGIYGEVGYEWIDGFDASVGNLDADVDFSSLMVSAGLVIAF